MTLKSHFDLVRTALFDSNERDSIVANTKCQCHVNPLNQTTGPSLHESFCVGASDKNNVLWLSNHQKPLEYYNGIWFADVSLV